jgi:hypothetical protein
MAKRKVEYRDEGGKTRWFWSTDAKRVWEVSLDTEGPDSESLFQLKNRTWVLETFRVFCNGGEIEEHYAVRQVGLDEAYQWLPGYRQIGPSEEWPSELRDLAEGNRAKRPRTPPGEVKRKIDEYLTKHAEEYREYRKNGDTGAARAIFGRNAVARACGLSHSTVGQSEQCL